MKIRVALASAPVSLAERYGAFVDAASTEPSFGLVSLAAAARAAGAEAAVVEASAENLSVEETARRILRFEPDLVGLSATTAGICAAGELAGALKAARPTAVVVIGGCHATALPGETLTTFAGFDLAARGEGERTLAELIARMTRERGTTPSGVRGTVEREDGGVRANPGRELIDNLDELPLPAWSLLAGFPRAYRPSPARIRRSPCASVVLTRGCPNKCTFCDRSVFGNRCRSYSPEYAVRLLADLRENFGVKEVLIEDDTFVIRKGNVREFCERLLASRLDLTWSCLGRADRVDLALLKLMRKAGCWHMSFGIESGDAAILESVKKNLNLDQVARAVRACKQAGIRTKGFFMVGFPGESSRTLEATSRLACSLPLDDLSVMQLTPFPGSELYATAEQFGTFEKDWRRMNTLETVFVPQGLTRRELEAARSRMIRRFYLRPRIILSYAARLARQPGRLGAMWHGLAAFAKTGLAQRAS